MALEIKLVAGEPSVDLASSHDIFSVSEDIPVDFSAPIVEEVQATQHEKTQEANAKSSGNKASSATNVKTPASVESKTSLLPKYYYSADELERRPKPLFPVTPAYPRQALDTAGKVTLLLLIDEKGVVDDFRVLYSEPKGVFDKESIQAFSKARYAAGRMAGLPVKSQFVVDVTFEPGNDPQVDVAPMTAR